MKINISTGPKTLNNILIALFVHYKVMVVTMKRNKIIETLSQDKLLGNYSDPTPKNPLYV